MTTRDRAEAEALLALRSTIDEILEEGLIHRLNLAEVMAKMLPALADQVGASGTWIESYGENLQLQIFAWPDALAIPKREEVFRRTGSDAREHVVLDSDDGKEVVVAQPLDVAGEWFGNAGLVFPKDRMPKNAEQAQDLLTMACEELDNFLYAIRAAREKHNIMMELGVALRHRVLGQGLRKAIDVLSHAVPLDRMLLVYVAEENAESTLHVQLYEKGAIGLDTMSQRDDALTEQVRGEGRDYLQGRGAKLLERFHFVNAQEEVLINGITKTAVVGKILVTSKSGAFNTYDRELLGGFAGFIRQRVVDFNKEWRRLAASFRDEDVARLLQADDYEQRWLTPREALVAMLYVDISGFTRISEQILRTPSAVATLVEEWSKDAVGLVWQHGGVFDKMVGDCVIALFGPPFYDATPGESLAKAIDCAVAIRDMTQKLPERPSQTLLRGSGIGVSTGVNLAPLFVGTFGPNGNFTGFSSGMNNTARLQGCAKKDAILVMEEAVAALPPGHPYDFAETESAAVKNVEKPLRFRALRPAKP